MNDVTTSDIQGAFRMLHLPLDKSSVPVVAGHLMIWLGYWNHQQKKQISKELRAIVMAYVRTQTRDNT